MRITLKLCSCCWIVVRTPTSAVNMFVSRACWLRPLCHATNPDIVTMLLDAGAEVNALQRSSTDTETALHRAAYFQPSVGELLIARGADVNITNEMDCTARYQAIVCRHHGLAACLVQVRVGVGVGGGVRGWGWGWGWGWLWACH